MQISGQPLTEQVVISEKFFAEIFRKTLVPKKLKDIDSALYLYGTNDYF